LALQLVESKQRYLARIFKRGALSITETRAVATLVPKVDNPPLSLFESRSDACILNEEGPCIPKASFRVPGADAQIDCVRALDEGASTREIVL
jgi:hypothetical protein